MSASIEQRAVRYLVRYFDSPKYYFEATGANDSELYLIARKTKRRCKIELKSTAAKHKRDSDIFNNFVFSRNSEVQQFTEKKSKVVRIFMGNKPPKIFLLSMGILAKGAVFEQEDRFVLRGAKSYKGVTPLR